MSTDTPTTTIPDDRQPVAIATSQQSGHDCTLLDAAVAETFETFDDYEVRWLPAPWVRTDARSRRERAASHLEHALWAAQEDDIQTALHETEHAESLIECGIDLAAFDLLFAARSAGTELCSEEWQSTISTAARLLVGGGR